MPIAKAATVIVRRFGKCMMASKYTVRTGYSAQGREEVCRWGKEFCGPFYFIRKSHGPDSSNRSNFIGLKDHRLVCVMVGHPMENYG